MCDLPGPGVEPVSPALAGAFLTTAPRGKLNPILLRPVLGIVLPRDSVLLKMEQLMSWLQSGHHAVSFFPVVAVTVSIKQLRSVHQTLSL